MNYYRPISLRPIFDKMFKTMIYNSLFTIFYVIGYSHLLNQIFFWETHVLLNYYQRFMKNKLHLMKISLLM